MRFVKKFFKVAGYTLAVLLLIIILFCGYVWKVATVKPPEITDTSALTLQKKHIEGSLYTIGDNWIRKNEYGLYEMYVSGKPFELGVKSGKLSQQLIADQEAAFTRQIKQIIPSQSDFKFLKYAIGFMNRYLPDHVTDEYKREIYGMSFSASIHPTGENNYTRLLHYQTVHDIGHILPDIVPMGSTSFGAWGAKTTNGALLLGRNFDFGADDNFVENKIVAFYKPDQGHRFAFITWGGFMGVVSGMNDKGLTVTVNAARSAMPWGGAATPVSLVAREILQYASNIKEAVAIAHCRKVFVSTSFLIGSATDHKAVIIEKTPDTLAVYDPNSDHILCTNHYQSKLFKDQQLNREQIAQSSSQYRYNRLQELMNNNYPLTPEKAATILRDRLGLHGFSIGDGNERAINRFTTRHSVIFQPDSLRMWVSTSPWQLGTYVCYDLKKIFAMNGLQQDREIADAALNIAPDTFLYSNEFKQFELFRKNKIALMQQQPVDTAQVVHSNPYFYDAYCIAGDYCKERKWYPAAINYYVTALSHIVPTTAEKQAIQKKIIYCERKYDALPN